MSDSRPLVGSLTRDLPDAGRCEIAQDLLLTPGFRIERIVSQGQASPDGSWYDQAKAEWVLVVQGRARLEIDSPSRILELGPGEWVHLPAHCRHRVDWTDPDQPTLWLAVHER